MEARVRERLVGALVLVAIVVLLVPSVLRGRDPAPADAPEPAPRRVVVPLGPAKDAPAEEILVPEPVAPRKPPAAVEQVAPMPDVSRATAPPAREARATRPEISASESQPVTTGEPRPEAPAWAVQLGAFSNRAKADELVLQLKKRGYAAFVLEYRASGKVLYRVRVGPEQDRARAAEIAARLAKDGFQTVVARHP